MHRYSEILIPKIQIWVSLGCSEAERATAQPVDMELKILFFEELPGCVSDELDEVICYKTVTEQIIFALEGRSFHLLEALTRHVFAKVKEHLQRRVSINALVEVAVTKWHHRIPEIQKGVVFKYRGTLSEKSSLPLDPMLALVLSQ